MAINITTAYSGEVLDLLLVKATTENELVSRGIIRLEPNVSDKFYIPRLRASKMLQKRKEQPEDKDSKGDFNIDERMLKPEEFMAFATFNPRSFEKIWKKWQPKGNLVFRELPVEAQNALLGELAKVVNFELGGHFINGEFGNDDDHLFNGILTRILADKDVIRIPAVCGSMKDKLRTVYRAIPKAIRKSKNLRFLMSTEDWDKYDDELTDQSSKGSDTTGTNPKRFKNIPIEDMAEWPEGVIVATICGMDLDTNLWAGVSSVNDFDAIQIDKLTNAGEKYFFKMLMKADTNIAWGDEVVLYDERGIFAASQTDLHFEAAGGSQEITVNACCEEFTVTGKVTGFTATRNGNKVSVVATANTGAAERGGKFSLKLKSDSKKIIEITVSQDGVQPAPQQNPPANENQ